MIKTEQRKSNRRSRILPAILDTLCISVKVPLQLITYLIPVYITP